MHDFTVQEQGIRNRVTKTAFLVTDDRLIETTASLYRPKTKKGDKRIWFYGLGRYCKPSNLLAIITLNNSFYVFNMSIRKIRESIGLVRRIRPTIPRIGQQIILPDLHITKASTIMQIEQENEYGIGFDILQQIYQPSIGISNELFVKLEEIFRRGYIINAAHGNRGVGETLEQLIGIQRNNKKKPDYKGIELKSHKEYVNSKNKYGLFAKCPDWDKSNYSEEMFLHKFGHEKDGKFELHCLVTAKRPNPETLQLEIDVDKDCLYCIGQVNGQTKKLLRWDLDVLRKFLKNKHKETFWAKVNTEIRDGIEWFQYYAYIHTKNPNAALFGSLVDEGAIILDLTFSASRNGGNHGYLFKIIPAKLPMLFPSPIEYDLRE